MSDQSTEARLREAVSQEAREAAAKAVRCGYPGGGNGNKVVADAIKGGLTDSYSIVQAFAQFERDILARLRAELGSSPTASEVLAYLDYFAGQENTPDEVCDFVQKAARFIDQRKTVDEWRADSEMDQFVDWCIEQRALNK